MDIKYQIVAEEIKVQVDSINGNKLLPEAHKKAMACAVNVLALNLASRFSLCDYAFNSNEFMTKCGLMEEASTG